VLPTYPFSLLRTLVHAGDCMFPQSCDFIVYAKSLDVLNAFTHWTSVYCLIQSELPDPSNGTAHKNLKILVLEGPRALHLSHWRLTTVTPLVLCMSHCKRHLRSKLAHNLPAQPPTPDKRISRSANLQLQIYKICYLVSVQPDYPAPHPDV
jgi:hypothetical protein